MKKIVTVLISILLFNAMQAQKQSDIKLMAVLETKDQEIISNAKDLLLNKIKDEITRDGYAGVNTSRFIVLVNPQVTDRQNNGQLVLYTYNLQFSVVDLMADKTYNSFSIQMGGAGKNSGQAIMDATRRVNFAKTKLADNIKDATQQIVKYYNDNCSAIIAKTNLLLNAKQYEAAFANIAFIPDINEMSCKNEYNAILLKAFKQYDAYKCNATLLEARKEWNLNPTLEGSQLVSAILTGINLTDECKKDFNVLISEIKAKLTGDAFDEKEFRKKVYDNEVNLQKTMLTTYRDIAVEYYKNMMPSVYLYLR